MNLKSRIEQDLKTALLEGDKLRVSTLRTVKNAILYIEVEKGARDKGLDDQTIVSILNKEAKKRQESVDLYKKAGEEARAEQELKEKAIIESYLPPALSEAQINELVDIVLGEIDKHSPQAMGVAIAQVKERSNGAADGATIARLVKDKLAT
jgi:uncharacterized protein YqeY